MSKPTPWYADDLEVLFDEDTIADRVQELGKAITDAYRRTVNVNHERMILVGLMKGCYMFLSDLSKTIDLPIRIDMMNVKSYSGTNSTGTVKLLKDLDFDLMNTHILICEDLIDTGTTLAWLQKHLETKGPASVKICTFLRKRTKRRKVNVKIDFCGFECEDEFIVGYGMDFDERYRNLPIIGVLHPKIYEEDEEQVTK